MLVWIFLVHLSLVFHIGPCLAQSLSCSCDGPCSSLNITSCSVGACDAYGDCYLTCQVITTTTMASTTTSPSCYCDNCQSIPSISFGCTTSSCTSQNCTFDCGWLTTTTSTTTSTTTTTTTSTSTTTTSTSTTSTTTTTTSTTTLACNCENWPGWSNCSLSRFQGNSSVESQVDCYDADLVTSPSQYIEQIYQAQATQIAEINNQTQTKLAELQQKYAVTDQIGYSVNVIAIVSIALIYVFALLSDLANFFPSLFKPLFKKKITGVPGSNQTRPRIQFRDQVQDPHIRTRINMYDSYFFNVEMQLLRAMIKKKQLKRWRVQRH